MPERVIVFDIETVPDLTAARALLCAGVEIEDGEIRRLLGERYAKRGKDPAGAFLKPVLHRVACLAALSASRTGPRTAWTVERLGALHIEMAEEREIVARFAASLAGSPGPVLVGFNTSGFDLPVLRYRAMALGVAAGPLHAGNGRNYWHRYGVDHVDLCDVLSGYSASSKPSLAEVAALVRVPAKAGGVDGSQVEGLVANGRLQEVADYCETDVVSLYLIYLRWQLAVGALDEETHTLSVSAMRAFVAERAERRPHLRQYTGDGCGACPPAPVAMAAQ